MGCVVGRLGEGRGEVDCGVKSLRGKEGLVGGWVGEFCTARIKVDKWVTQGFLKEVFIQVFCQTLRVVEPDNKKHLFQQRPN